MQAVKHKCIIAHNTYSNSVILAVIVSFMIIAHNSANSNSNYYYFYSIILVLCNTNSHIHDTMSI